MSTPKVSATEPAEDQVSSNNDRFLDKPSNKFKLSKWQI
jgi:hypothetical protein